MRWSMAKNSGKETEQHSFPNTSLLVLVCMTQGIVNFVLLNDMGQLIGLVF